MAPFNHFDFLAPYYDRFIKLTDLSRFYEMAGLPASGLLLDLAGGTGRKSHPMLKMVTGIVIADSSEGMLAQARQKAGLHAVRSEAEQLPFMDESFERVIMVDALHHVANHQETTREMWRVLKPGGRIVIEEPDIRYLPVKLMAAFEKVALMRSHFVSPQGIEASFDYPNAKVQVEKEDMTAWIVIDKQAQ